MDYPPKENSIHFFIFVAINEQKNIFWLCQRVHLHPKVDDLFLRIPKVEYILLLMETPSHQRLDKVEETQFSTSVEAIFIGL